MTVRVDIAVRFADQAQSVQHLSLFSEGGSVRLLDGATGNQNVAASTSGARVPPIALASLTASLLCLAVGVKGVKVLVVPEAIVTAATAPYGYIGVGFAALAAVTIFVSALTVVRNRRRAALRAQQHDSVRMFDLIAKRGGAQPDAARASIMNPPAEAQRAATSAPDLSLPRCAAREGQPRAYEPPSVCSAPGSMVNLAQAAVSGAQHASASAADIQA
jgi:hypothetical protein